MKRFALIALALLVCLGANAKLSLREPCSDRMVLQQNTQAVIWGHASAGASITVTPSWNGKSYKAKTASDGIWKAYVDTPGASYRTYTVKVSGDGGSYVINDVLVGEVWIASGQSNMEMPIRGFFNCPVEGANEVVSGTRLDGKVRMFTVAIYQPEEPIVDVHETRGWEDANQATVAEMSATAFFFARKLQAALDVPVGIVALPRGGAAVESWLPKSTLAAWGDDVSAEGNAKRVDWTKWYVNYNGMEQPVCGYTAKGFIWYQGCSNVGRDDTFVERMTELVRQWREDWGDAADAMPFYQVEIAPYQYKGSFQYEKAPALRKAQHDAAASIPNSAIVVTNDLAYDYEVDNIHPCQKQKVGERLAYLALNRDYGFSRVACYSPEAVRAYRPDDKSSEIWVELSNCPNGLDRWQLIEGLEVCGSEQIFKPVQYAYFEYGPNALRIRCEGVFDPSEVRYGWADFKPGNLHNAEGLPVSPFWIKLQ